MRLIPILMAGVIALSPVGSAPVVDWPGQVSRLRSLLEVERFSELETVLTAAQDRFDQGEAVEDEPWAAFQAFLENDPSIERALSAWVTQAPASYPALAARGLYYHTTGFAVRGTAWIGDTSPGRLRRMNSLHSKAEADCGRALAIKPSLVACHVALINIAKAAGDATRAHDRFVQARAALPASAFIALAYLKTLTPRWGGSYAEMATFLAEIEAAPVGRTAAGKALQGEILADQAQMAAVAKDFAKAVELYTGAIAKGGGCARYFASRGVNAARLHRDEDALSDYDRAIAAGPRGWPYSEATLAQVLASRARLRHLAGRDSEAQADIRAALVLSPNTEWIQRYARDIDPLTRP